MKKLLLWFLTLALLLSMAACGETETDTQSNDDTEKTESNAENGNNTQSTPDGESTPGSESGDAGNTDASSDTPTALLTPESIFALLEDADSIRLTMTVDFGDALNMITVMDRQGETYYLSTSLRQGEISFQNRQYLFVENGKYYELNQNEDETWEKAESQFTPEELGLETFLPLFASSNYGQPDANGRYAMNESFVFDYQHIDFGNGYLEQKGGVYTVVLTGANDGLEGTMTITIDQVNSTSITLPQA